MSKKMIPICIPEPPTLIDIKQTRYESNIAKLKQVLDKYNIYQCTKTKQYKMEAK